MALGIRSVQQQVSLDDPILHSLGTWHGYLLRTSFIALCFRHVGCQYSYADDQPLRLQDHVKSSMSEEEQISLRFYIEERMHDVDALVTSVQDAPPDVLVPALELLIKIYGAIIDRPDEPKV